jgi:hypothetical protein
MSDLARLIGLIQERMQLEAVQGIRTPREKTAFELGRLNGVQTGLDISLQLINEVLAEDEHPKTKAGRK